MAEHTELPWMVGSNGRSVIRHVPDLADGYDHFMVSVASAHSLVSGAEAAANAALIVRAVNSHDALVKALKSARYRLDKIESQSNFETHHEVAEIDAALAQCEQHEKTGGER